VEERRQKRKLADYRGKKKGRSQKSEGYLSGSCSPKVTGDQKISYKGEMKSQELESKSLLPRDSGLKPRHPRSFKKKREKIRHYPQRQSAASILSLGQGEGRPALLAGTTRGADAQDVGGGGDCRKRQAV